jgi:hypothetical protein
VEPSFPRDRDRVLEVRQAPLAPKRELSAGHDDGGETDVRLNLVNALELALELGRISYFATSTARLSRITVTLTWPGYSSWLSISRAISCESSTASSSSISLGFTITRISRPA